MNFNGEIFYDGNVIYSGNLEVHGNVTVDGVLYLPDGSSGAPSLAFKDEKTLGFYRYGSGTVKLAGSQLRVDNLDVRPDGMTVAGASVFRDLLTVEDSVSVSGQADIGGDLHVDSGTVSTTRLIATTEGLHGQPAIGWNTGEGFWLNGDTVTVVGASNFEIEMNTQLPNLSCDEINVFGDVSMTNGLLSASSVAAPAIAGTSVVATASMSTPSIQATSATAPLLINTTLGSTSSGMSMLQIVPGTSTAGFLFGVGVLKGSQALMEGINKNSVTGEVPASAAYISTESTSTQLSIGRGSTNLPSSADILISTNGSVSLNHQPYVRFVNVGTTTTIGTTSTVITTWSTTPAVSTGTVATTDGTTFTIPVAGTYTLTLLSEWTPSSTSAKIAWIAIPADTTRYAGATAPAASGGSFSTLANGSATLPFVAGGTFQTFGLTNLLAGANITGTTLMINKIA